MGDSISGNINGYLVWGISIYLYPRPEMSDFPSIIYVALSQVGFQFALSRRR
jgi:hypothetical protein